MFTSVRALNIVRADERFFDTTHHVEQPPGRRGASVLFEAPAQTSDRVDVLLDHVENDAARRSYLVHLPDDLANEIVDQLSRTGNRSCRAVDPLLGLGDQHPLQRHLSGTSTIVAISPVWPPAS